MSYVDRKNASSPVFSVEILCEFAVNTLFLQHIMRFSGPTQQGSYKQGNVKGINRGQKTAIKRSLYFRGDPLTLQCIQPAEVSTMFYQLGFFTLLLSLFMLSATCAEALRVQNRTFYSLFVTCESLDKYRHFIKKPDWQEIKHNSTRNISHCSDSLKIARSTRVTKIVPMSNTGAHCSTCVNLHKHMLEISSTLPDGYTLNGFPTSMYACWDDDTVG